MIAKMRKIERQKKHNQKQSFNSDSDPWERVFQFYEKMTKLWENWEEETMKNENGQHIAMGDVISKTKGRKRTEHNKWLGRIRLTEAKFSIPAAFFDFFGAAFLAVLVDAFFVFFLAPAFAGAFFFFGFSPSADLARGFRVLRPVLILFFKFEERR